MFIKVYEYHIQPDKETEYLEIQEKAGEIYSRHIDSHSLHLKSRDDPSKWMEITRYRNEEEYERSIQFINQEEEIQDLFKQFQALLGSEINEIREENFHLVKERGEEVSVERNHEQRDAKLISERDKIKESIKKDLENDKHILAFFYGGSMARGNHDRYSDLDLRIVVNDEMYEEYRKNKKGRAERWGDVLFYEDFPWARHTVAHYKNFVKVDAFYYKQEDLRPSLYLKEETQIEYDPNGIVTAVSEQSRDLYYEPSLIEFEVWRSKFFAHMHEVYRRVMRGELYYALHSLDMMRWSVAAGWDMTSGRQPNAPGDWSKYEGERSPFDQREQELLAGWNTGRDAEGILEVMKKITMEFKSVHSRLSALLGLDEQAEWVEEIVSMVV